MAKKKKNNRPTEPDELGSFGDLEDEFFSMGDSGSFWEDEEEEGAEEDPTEAVKHEFGKGKEAPTEVVEPKGKKTKQAPPPPPPKVPTLEQQMAEQSKLVAKNASAPGLSSNPTIIAMDEEEDAGDFATDALTEQWMSQGDSMAEDAPAVSEAIAEQVDSEEVSATADMFLEEDGDPSLVMRKDKLPLANATIDIPSPPSLADAETVIHEPPSEEVEVEQAVEEAPAVPEPAAPEVPEPVVPEPVVAPALPAYTPNPEAAGRWREAVDVLLREIEVESDPAAKASLQGTAGWIALHRLGDPSLAQPLIDAAIASDVEDEAVLRAHEALARSGANPTAIRQALERRATASRGPVAAELLAEAAGLERERQGGDAIALLERALEVNPGDWNALLTLRSLYRHEKQWDKLDQNLASMAEVAQGAGRAALLIERGELAESQLENTEGALAHYRSALELVPNDAVAFLAAERMATRLRDHQALVDLYQKQADGLGSNERAYWASRAARAGAGGERPHDEIAKAYQTALSAHPSPELNHEFEAYLAKSGQWAALVETLDAEASTIEGADKAFLLFRIGSIYERDLEDEKQALKAYEGALAADPTAAPAADAIARLQQSSGGGQDLIAGLTKRLADAQDDIQKSSIHLRMGEIYEGTLNDATKAQEAYEKVLVLQPAHGPAGDALERVYRQTKAWAKLGELFANRGEAAEGAAKAPHLHQASRVFEARVGDPARALTLTQAAFDADPAFAPARQSLIRLLEDAKDWDKLAPVLRTAMEHTTDDGRLANLAYRTARVLADHAGDSDGAVACLRKCLEINPGFAPGLDLMRELANRTGAWDQLFEMNRAAADATDDLRAKGWRLLLAAEAAEHIEGQDPTALLSEVLYHDPGHAGALAALEDMALRSGELKRVVEIYGRRVGAAEDDTARAHTAVALAVAARDCGEQETALKAIDEVLAAEVDGRPLVAVARLAESLSAWKAAVRALKAAGATEHLAELARLQETYGDAPAEAVEAWRAVLEVEPDNPVAAAGFERCLRRVGEPDGQAEAHTVLADTATDAPSKARHALLAGRLFHDAGDLDKATELYRQSFDAQPGKGKAFDALVRLYADAQDADAIEGLFGALPEPDGMGLAAAFEEAEAPGRAAGVYASLLKERGNERSSLGLLVALEQNQAAADDWKGVFETLSSRVAVIQNDDEKRAIEAKRRWVLAEKLASTEEAWEFYRKLHEENPQDTEVLEALARIAGARGETALGIQYLDGLAELAKDKSESARYQRRIAEVHVNAGDLEAARQAYLKALDFQPSDMDALSGLKTLATQEENWQALLGVLAREATMLEGDEQVARNREIARIWQDRVGDKAVATDAWKKLLDMVPGDKEALTELVGLYREAEDWNGFSDVAQALIKAKHVEGAEQSALYGELGKVFLQHLRRQQEAIQFLDAGSSGKDPNLEAAQLLEQVYAGKDWAMVAEALIRQSRAAADQDKLGLLLRAAQIRLERLHERDGAAQIFARVLELAPSNPEALRFQGDYLFQQKNWEKAVDIFERMEESEMERDLDDFDVKIEVSLYFYRFASALQTLGRSAEARARFERALDLNPSHLPTLEAVGPLYIEMKNWEKARNCFRTLLQLTGGQGDPGQIARVYTNLGIVEHQMGDLDKAMKRFNKALELKANDIPALQGIAGVLFTREDWNNLLNVYNNIIYHAQEPAEVLDAYLTKGFVLDAKLELPDKAEQHYQKSLALNPAQPMALLRLAELALRREDWPEAASLADRGLGLKNDSSSVRAGLHLVRAIALRASGDEKNASEGFNSALNADVTLTETLGNEMGTTEQVHQVLRGRLQARV